MPKPRTTTRPLTGFTLVELMVALAVAAIMVTAAVPGFQSVINGNRLSASANEMVASLQLARMEAVRRNQRAAVCASANANDGTDATCASSAIDGWLTFVDANGDGDFDKAGDTLLRVSQLDGTVTLLSSPSVGSQIVFRPDGMARDEDGGSGPGSGLLDGIVAFCIATTVPANNARYVELASGSRMTISAHDGDGACVAPEDP